MPKFKMEQSYHLHDLLPHMGVASIFNYSANLTRLSKNKGLKLSEVGIQFQSAIINILAFSRLQMMTFISCGQSQVLHKAVIEVDEKGTTAAAATTAGIIAYSLPRTFYINKPFFFFIYHEDTNCLLFMGRVIDPSKY